MINTPLDQMYVDGMLFAMFGMITGRNMTLMQMVHHNGHLRSRRDAGFMMVVNALGLGLSIAVPVVLYMHFGSVANVVNLVNQMVGFWSYAMWGLIGFHLLFIPYFGYMAYWLWKKRNTRLADALIAQAHRPGW